MCGIAGIIRITTPRDGDERRHALTRPHAEAIPEQWLDILDASVRHRGPDGQGRFRDRAIRSDGAIVDVALVHRRLSIIDHKDGAQPMVSLRGPGGAGAAVHASVAKGAPSASSGPGAADGPGATSGSGAVSGGSVAARAPSAASGSCTGATAADRDLLPPPLLFLGKPTATVDYRPLPARPDDDLVAVVFNGCIYNHRELRAELQSAGHRFETDHSDTEVLIHGWREWPSDFAPRLNAMFSVAFWDRARGEITLSRDTFGEKPLYTLDGNDVRAFSASVPGLLRLESAAPSDFPPPSSDDRRALTAPWVQYGWNQGLTPIPSIREVVAGCYDRFPPRPPSREDDGPWFMPCEWTRGFVNPTSTPLSAATAEMLLAAAVASRLEADVPLGAFLSGGIDSALVTALAARARPDIAAYTVKMPSPDFDESDAAAATARAIGVRHRVLGCDARPAEDLHALVAQLGLPFGDSSLLPSLWVSRSARREVSVALSGDGGDEMFLGYDRHRAIRWLKWLGRLPRDQRLAIAESLPLGSRRGRRSMLDRAARLASAAAHDGYKELVAIFPAPLDASLGLAAPRTHFGLTSVHGSGIELETVALRFDRWFYLPCDLMRKSDTASMSVALEVRSPMLETNLARAAIDAPLTSLMPKGQRKGLLKQVARKYLPAEIVDRPKQGFAIPIGEWFRSDYGGLRTLLLDRLHSREPFGPPSLGIDLNRRFIQQMLDEHLGTGMSGRVTRDHSQRLYMLLVLSLWTDTLKH